MKDNRIVDTERSLWKLEKVINQLNKLGNDFYKQENWIEVNEILGRLEWIVIENLSSDANDYFFKKWDNEMRVDEIEELRNSKV